MNDELTQLDIEKMNFIDRVISLVGAPCNDTLYIYSDDMGETLESNNFEATDEVCYAYNYLDLDIEQSQAEQQSILDNAKEILSFYSSMNEKNYELIERFYSFFYENNRPTNKDNYEIFAHNNDLSDFSINNINLKDFE